MRDYNLCKAWSNNKNVYKNPIKNTFSNILSLLFLAVFFEKCKTGYRFVKRLKIIASFLFFIYSSDNRKIRHILIKDGATDVAYGEEYVTSVFETESSTSYVKSKINIFHKRYKITNTFSWKTRTSEIRRKLNVLWSIEPWVRLRTFWAKYVFVRKLLRSYVRYVHDLCSPVYIYA